MNVIDQATTAKDLPSLIAALQALQAEGEEWVVDISVNTTYDPETGQLTIVIDSDQ